MSTQKANQPVQAEALKCWCVYLQGKRDPKDCVLIFAGKNPDAKVIYRKYVRVNARPSKIRAVREPEMDEHASSADRFGIIKSNSSLPFGVNWWPVFDLKQDAATVIAKEAVQAAQGVELVKPDKPEQTVTPSFLSSMKNKAIRFFSRK